MGLWRDTPRVLGVFIVRTRNLGQVSVIFFLSYLPWAVVTHAHRAPYIGISYARQYNLSMPVNPMEGCKNNSKYIYPVE